MLTKCNLYKNMAWWGHNLLLRANAEEAQKNKGDDAPAVFSQSVKDLIYNNFLAGLHFVLSILTYSYLFLLIYIFFLQSYASVPRLLLDISESLSEPYLGLIGVYLFVKEIRRRRGVRKKRFEELFVTLWLMLLFTSSVLILTSQKYHFGPIYNLILTNSLAALIIRLGTVLHF